MHIRYNTTSKLWEKSTDMSSWADFEQSFTFDGDMRFGSSSAADIIGTSTIRYFSFDGQTKVALINVGMSQSGTANLLSGISFHNRAIGAADKRIATILASTNGATNSGKLELGTFNAGVFNSVFQVLANTSMILGVGLAVGATNGFPYIPSCAGTPTGTPTAVTGMIPLIYDRTNNILYAYSNGAWRAH